MLEAKSSSRSRVRETIRASYSCGLLLGADSSIKEVAHASDRLASAFRTHVGVAPGEYRRIFAEPASDSFGRLPGPDLTFQPLI